VFAFDTSVPSTKLLGVTFQEKLIFLQTWNLQASKKKTLYKVSVVSTQPNSSSLKFRKSRSGSYVISSCHHSSSRSELPCICGFRAFLLTFICLRATLSYDLAHRAVRS
jgi:hypothetical protein